MKWEIWWFTSTGDLGTSTNTKALLKTKKEHLRQWGLEVETIDRHVESWVSTTKAHYIIRLLVRTRTAIWDSSVSLQFDRHIDRHLPLRVELLLTRGNNQEWDWPHEGQAWPIKTHGDGSWCLYTNSWRPFYGWNLHNLPMDLCCICINVVNIRCFHS